MKTEVYIVLTRFGAERMTKRQASIGRDEIAVKLRLSVPDSAFRSPIITADLEVADTHVIQPALNIEVVAEPKSNGEEQ